jgi:hypothetical protein
MGGGDTSGRTSRVSGPTLVLGGMDRGSSREVGPAGAAHGVPLAHDTRGQPRPTDAVSARLDRLYGSQADGATPRLLSTLPTLAMCALITDRNMRPLFKHDHCGRKPRSRPARVARSSGVFNEEHITGTADARLARCRDFALSGQDNR